MANILYDLVLLAIWVNPPLIERPNVNIKAIDGKKLAADLQGMADKLGIDLSQADKRKTAEILKRMPPMSDEIANMTDPD